MATYYIGETWRPNLIMRDNRQLVRTYSEHRVGLPALPLPLVGSRDDGGGKSPWSYLDDDDQWLKVALKPKAQETAFCT